MAYRASFVKSVQSGTIVITAGATTNTYSLPTPVNTAYAVVNFRGQYGIDSNNLVALFARLTLTDANTVTATRAGGVSGSLTVSFDVIEFLPHAVRYLHAGTIAMSDGGAASNTDTVAVSNLAKASLFHGGACSSGGISSGNNIAAVQCGIVLADSATVMASRASISGSGATVGYTVVEFK